MHYTQTTPTMPYVWIINEAGHDYEDAEQYGEVRPLTLGDVNPLHLDRLNWHITRGVVRYASADDYLLISGTPIINAAVLLIWMTHFKEAKILQWNAKHRHYVLATITSRAIENLIERELTR